AASLDAAVAGQDAVLAAFGPRSLKKDDLQEVFDLNLTAAMRKQGVRRLVNLSAMGAGDSRPLAPWLFRSVILPLLLGNVFADKERGEAVLFASGLDVVNVRPGRLLNSRARGPLRASLDGGGLSAMVTREDLAAFMVDQLDRPDWLGKSPLVGY
ncbi:MAG TPA: NAD(P)-binding oxidoreductase, partial [bacterium]|nr:NAD(P)-binding oxidoreductase [bacterium]